MLLTELAFRNLGRNLRRSLITGFGLALSTALCVAYYAVADGMNAELVHSLTRFDLGHLQVHARGWGKGQRLDAMLPEPERELASIRGVPGVLSAAPRLYASALVGSRRRSTGAELVGIDPKAERRVTELDRQLVKGHFLPDGPTPWPAPRELSESERVEDRRLTDAQTAEAMDEIGALAPLDAPAGAASSATTQGSSDTGASAPSDEGSSERATADRLAKLLSPRPERPPPVVLGTSLARVLSVGVGDELYLSAQAAEGSAEGIRVSVAGIYETGTAAYDRGRIYLHIADLGRLVHRPGQVHEIAALAGSAAEAPSVAAAAERALGGAPVSVRAWSQLRPDLKQLLDLNRASSAMLALIVFFVASLGVVNTMLMAVSERTRELGVLKAIGMSGVRVFAMIVAESTALSLSGAAAGALLGLAFDLYLVRYGIDLSSMTRGISFSGIGMAPVVHGEIRPDGVLVPVALLAAICVVSAFYPAFRAARLEPAVGMRET